MDAFLTGWDDAATVGARLGPALSSRCGAPVDVVSAALRAPGAHSGLSGDMQVLAVAWRGAPGDGAAEYMLKRTRKGGEAASAALGLWREAEFYASVQPLVSGALADAGAEVAGCALGPGVVFQAYNAASGAKVIVMDRVPGVESGVFFPHTPHNDSRRGELAALTQPYPGVTQVTLTLQAAQMCGALHGRTWRDARVLTYPGLRGAAWLEGKGQDTFDASMEKARAGWAARRARLQEREAHAAAGRDAEAAAVAVARYTPDLAATIEASLSQAAFDAHVAAARARGWSFVHGDLHPGNFVVTPCGTNPAGVAQVLVDWEMCGVGSGAQDLGQYMISHLAADVAAQIFPAVADAYSAALAAAAPPGAALPTAAAVKEEMAAGGFCRWVWLEAYMGGMPGLPVAFQQHFHDQMAAWAALHGITAANVGMPRP
eukprot:TRINITY_DN2976_c0_g1_i3.p1 TRINITY_DN2976_c0_g1~~TRINITY_DN2976_c0_g1_i3.p1  ORF type:complete len:456 (+),score=141.33 TRINITY_DN2976_c0_g1_i3:77-1369(+)